MHQLSIRRCRSWGGFAFRFALALPLALAMGGCAFTYTDSEGARHAIGLLDVTVKQAAPPETIAGDVIAVTSLGLSIGQSPQGGYVTAGYSRAVSAVLRDNALVVGNPVKAVQ